MAHLFDLATRGGWLRRSRRPPGARAATLQAGTAGAEAGAPGAAAATALPTQAALGGDIAVSGASTAPDGLPSSTARRPAILVDSSTHTWWRPGAPRSETLVEALAPRAAGDGIARRVAALTAGSLPAGSFRPGRVAGTADPAFSELLLVELLRAGRWERAFGQLAPECQRAWASPDALAAAHAGVARSIAAARVTDVRALDEWTDEERETRWTGVAELVVEYQLRGPDGLRPARRTVHLVEVDGQWRSLLFPPAPAAADARSPDPAR